MTGSSVGRPQMRSIDGADPPTNGGARSPVATGKWAERGTNSVLRLSLGGAVVVLSGVAISALMIGSSAANAAVTAGTAVITRPSQSTPMDSGKSATFFGVTLPAGASCPGDTAHHGYHVFSYLVPRGVPPTAVSFKTGLPSKYLGYFSYGRYYGAINTAEGTGQLVTLPPEFTIERWTSEDFLPGGKTSAIWDGGIACADIHGVVTNYWNTEFEFTASSADAGGYEWKVLHAPPASTNYGLLISIALIVLGVGLAIVALVLSRRQRGARHVGS